MIAFTLLRWAATGARGANLARVGGAGSLPVVAIPPSPAAALIRIA
ncbi:hypothetical protein [Belnapia moabensis]|nr:hypothetical protein [Belnapia moabensis]